MFPKFLNQYNFHCMVFDVDDVLLQNCVVIVVLPLYINVELVLHISEDGSEKQY